MEPGVGLALALALPVVALAALTGLGSRRRGNSVAGVVVQAVCFPATWVAWYVRDEMLGPGTGPRTDERA